MPELPEMETYRRLLTDKITQKPIKGVQVSREKSINLSPEQFHRELLGHRIVSIQRRAKHLIFELDHQKCLLLHLMLGGWMYYGREEDKPNRTTQVVISFGEESLYFIGLRLGYLHYHDLQELEEKLAKLGPEPMDPHFTDELFLKRIKKKAGRVKMTLVDQSFISGIGNCYSDEICFTAGVLPMKKGKDLSPQEKSRLYQSIRTVLEEATSYGGYMEHPLYKGDILTGSYDKRCKVYDRKDEPCVRCGRPIIQEELSARKVFYCSRCQH